MSTFLDIIASVGLWGAVLRIATPLIFGVIGALLCERAGVLNLGIEGIMVAGAFTEYAGMGFGVFFMGEYANIVVGCALATILFLGGWNSPLGVFDGIWWFFLKMYFLIFCVVWIRWTFPRTQFYGLLNLSWKILIPVALFTLLLSGVLIKLPHLF